MMILCQMILCFLRTPPMPIHTNVPIRVFDQEAYLRAIHWINLNHRQIEFRTIERP